MTSAADTQATGPLAERPEEPSRGPRGRKRYRRPRLRDYGDVRDVTMGVTPGGVESGPIPFREIGV